MRSRFWLVAGACVVCVAAAWRMPNPHRRVDWISETDGERRSSIVWFGRWRTNKAEKIPGIDVTLDFRKALRRANLQLPPSLENSPPTVRRASDRFWMTYRFEKRLKSFPKTDLSFFVAQLTRVRQNKRPPRKYTYIEGMCMGGGMALTLHINEHPSHVNVLLELQEPTTFALEECARLARKTSTPAAVSR